MSLAMNFTRTRFAIALATLLVCAGVATIFVISARKMPPQVNAASAIQDNRGAHLEIPKDGWETSFFAALDEHTKKVNLPSLRTVVLPETDLEVRFWYDARPYVINGFVIRRSDNQWSAVGIRQTNEGEPSLVKKEILPVPKSGWEPAWQRLVSAGILTLQDGSDLKCSPGVLDGGAYVVETNVDRVYRTYRYDNPQFSKCQDAKRILSIEQIIAEEFELHIPQK